MTTGEHGFGLQGRMGIHPHCYSSIPGVDFSWARYPPRCLRVLSILRFSCISSHCFNRRGSSSLLTRLIFIVAFVVVAHLFRSYFRCPSKHLKADTAAILGHGFFRQLGLCAKYIVQFVLGSGLGRNRHHVLIGAQVPQFQYFSQLSNISTPHADIWALENLRWEEKIYGNDRLHFHFRQESPGASIGRAEWSLKLLGKKAAGGCH